MSRIGKTAAVTMLFALGACGEISDDNGIERESARSVEQAVLNGRTSDASEDLNVFLTARNTSNSDIQRCSGVIVGPNVVMTARHCLLENRANNLNCTSDGKLVDGTDPRNEDVRTVPPANVTIHYGAKTSDFVSAGVTRVVTPVDLSVCRNDVALLVVERALVEHYAQIRVEPVRLREHFRFVGWGYTHDGTTTLPEERQALDDLMVKEVGPGLIPAGSFATGGNALCLGDSGGGAWIDNVLVGVYSRIEGDLCANPDGRSIFMMLAAHRALIESTFAAAGATPWFEGQPAPWLAKDGAACTSNDQCQSGLCTSSICGAPAPDASTTPDPAAKPGNPESCSATPRRHSTASFPTIIAGFCLAYVVRRKKLSRRLHTSLARTVGRVLRSSIGA